MSADAAAINVWDKYSSRPVTTRGGTSYLGGFLGSGWLL